MLSTFSTHSFEMQIHGDKDVRTRHLYLGLLLSKWQMIIMRMLMLEKIKNLVIIACNTVHGLHGQFTLGAGNIKKQIRGLLENKVICLTASSHGPLIVII